MARKRMAKPNGSNVFGEAVRAVINIGAGLVIAGMVAAVLEKETLGGFLLIAWGLVGACAVFYIIRKKERK